MKRLVSSLLVWAVAAVAWGQAAPPTADPVAAPPAATDLATVRFVHAAPNAGTQLVVLRRADGATGQQVSILEYGESSGDIPVPEGVYEVLLDPAALTGAGDPPVRLLDDFHATGGRHDTVVITGLAAVSPDGDGFGAWLEELGAPERPELALQALVLEDPMVADESRSGVDVRVVHAAPGTEGIELVLDRGGAVDILATARYLDVSEFTRIAPDAGTLDLRVAGGGPVVEGLADLDRTPGSIHTIVVIGTPLAAAPLAPIVVTHPRNEPVPVEAGTSEVAAVGPVIVDLDAAQADWVLELLATVEAHLSAAEAELAADPTSAAAAAALADLAAARQVLEAARGELPTDPPPSATPTPTPAASGPGAAEDAPR